MLGQDRLTTRSELDKLATYAHGAGRVEVADIEAVVADASALVLDHAVDGAFAGDVVAVETTTERLFAENGDVNQLLGSALRHASALHRAASAAAARARSTARARRARRHSSAAGASRASAAPWQCWARRWAAPVANRDSRRRSPCAR